MQAVVKQELRKFGEGTTIRGVPRILKSKSRLIRSMWLLTVFLCLGILTWQLYKTFLNYFQWPIDSIYREANVRPVFPDVTVCNIYPMAYANSMHLHYDDYLGFTSKKKQLLPYNMTKGVADVSEADYGFVWSLIMSPLGYFSSLPVSERARDLIIDYNYFSWDWSQNKVRGSFRGVWSPDYSMCYTLKLDRAKLTEVRALSLVVYIDNFPNVSVTATTYTPRPYTPRPKDAVATGIRVIVHAPGTQPNLKVGLSVGPGTETTLHVSNTLRTRLPSPYSSCTEERYLDDPDPSDDGGLAETYSKDACYEVCLQRQVVERCGCVSGFLQFTRRQMSLVNNTICGNQSLNAGVDSDLTNVDGFKQLACMLNADVDLDNCERQCLDSCEENQYDVVVSTAPWPHVTKQLDVFATYISGKGYDNIKREKFVEYGDIWNASKTLSAEEVVRRLGQLHRLEENFIQLNVIFDKMNPMTLRSVPAVTSEKLLSLVGGTLSLWLGITVVNAIEFIDFLYAVLLAVRKSKKTAPSPGSSTTDDQHKFTFKERAPSVSQC